MKDYCIYLNFKPIMESNLFNVFQTELNGHFLKEGNNTCLNFAPKLK